MVLLRLAPFITAVSIGAFAFRGGAFAFRGEVWAVGLTAIVPALVFAQTTRIRAGAVAVLYYAAASWPIVPCARSFWFLPATSLTAVAAWLAATLILSLPWLFLWTATRSEVFWRCPITLLIGAIPPIGLIGWASPLTSAGVLFPGSSWLGLASAAIIPSLRRNAAIAFGLVAVVANLAYIEPRTPKGWTAINTAIDTAARAEPVADFEAVSLIQNAASQSTSTFLLAPESAVMRWNEAILDLWRPTIDALTHRGATLLLGTSTALPGDTSYENLLIGIGKHPGNFVQRNPVPLAMWKPFGGKDSTPLRFTGRATLDIANHRAAVLICYEQLLTWPILQSAFEQPTLILGIANDYWCRGTHVPQAQQACTRAWARLFNIPALTATNYGGEE